MKAALLASDAYLLFACSAKATRLAILRRDVSSPAAATRIVRRPVRFNSPAATSSLGPTVTGRLSPVRSDLSRSLCPSATKPSTGILSPGRTSTRSPIRMASTGTSVSAPPSSRVARLGSRAASSSAADRAMVRVFSSRYRPASRKKVKASAASKKMCSPSCHVSKSDMPEASAIASDIGVSMFIRRFDSARPALMKNGLAE